MNTLLAILKLYNAKLASRSSIKHCGSQWPRLLEGTLGRRAFHWAWWHLLNLCEKTGNCLCTAQPKFLEGSWQDFPHLSHVWALIIFLLLVRPRNMHGNKWHASVLDRPEKVLDTIFPVCFKFNCEIRLYCGKHYQDACSATLKYFLPHGRGFQKQNSWFQAVRNALHDILKNQAKQKCRVYMHVRCLVELPT